jgi:myosin-7
VAINLKEPVEEYISGELAYVYSDDTMAEYKAMTDRNAAKPHAWALASKCWQNAFEPPEGGRTTSHQAIVITGESGAGKSFQTKKMLDFLAFVGRDPETPEEEESITDKMLSTTPILEGFGNANMPRNPDSSRFGKLYKIFFDRGSELITGCTITPYMLEKSRVSSQQIHERNYHMFYRMILGGWGEEPPTNKKGKVLENRRLPADGKDKHLIRDIMHYKYLKGGERPIPDADVLHDKRKDGEDLEDKPKMGETIEAMRPFFSPEQIDTIFNTTMGCLWMGNIEIGGNKDSSQVQDAGGSAEALDAVAHLWQVDRELLKASCNTKSLNIMRKWTPTALGKDAAISLRDAIAKTVYDLQFNWLVDVCSGVLAENTNEDRDVWIGVLDIFGFEFVETSKIVPFEDKKGDPTDAPSVNSFEQFCINFCNEQLQNQFVKCIFVLEKKLYMDQLGFEPEIKFTPNDSTLDLIVNRKTGIITKLDEVAKNPPKQGDPDVKFYDSMKKMKHERLDWPPTKGRNQYYGNGFELKHYAAQVRYDVKNWVSKDADEITHDTYACLGASADTMFLGQLFSKDAEDARNKEPPCIAGAFKLKLHSLIETLNYADCNFVRCLKATNPLLKRNFHAKEVLNQLKYTGMLDTLKIRRGGFAMRVPHRKFWDDFHVIDVQCENHVDLVESIKGKVDGWVAEMPEPPPNDQKNEDGTWDCIHTGTTLILARDWLQRSLEVKRKEILAVSAVIIQAAYRASSYMKEYKRQQGAWNIQSGLRTVNKTKPFTALRSTVLKIMPEMHAFTGRVIACRAADMANLNNAKAEMNAFLEDNRRLERAEADERKAAAAEDEYSWKLMDATFSSRVDADKKQYLTMGDAAYQQAIEVRAKVFDFIDSTARKGAESDARWQKMQTEGVVRAVPLIRQYRSEAVPFSPPTKDAYRFKYSFSYKGAKAAPKSAPAPEAPPMKGPGKGPPPIVKGLYWKMSNSDAVRWTPKETSDERDVENDITFATQEEFFAHRKERGLPEDFSDITPVEV